MIGRGLFICIPFESVKVKVTKLVSYEIDIV
jgi:hypothetical protein